MHAMTARRAASARRPPSAGLVAPGADRGAAGEENRVHPAVQEGEILCAGARGLGPVGRDIVHDGAALPQEGCRVLPAFSVRAA